LSSPRKRKAPDRPTSPPANLYVLSIFLTGGPVNKKFANKVVNRVIEIRGDQTLGQLHEAIFEAYDRWEQHLYEFQLGKRRSIRRVLTMAFPIRSQRRTKSSTHARQNWMNWA